jgi:hypothetical protein
LDWSGDPIEILFVDLAKTWALNSWVVAKTFPCLIPSVSVVVQQDWVHFNEYWVHITMAYFADRFELVETVYGASAVFRCIAPISIAEASVDLKALPIAEKLRLIDWCIERSEPSEREVLKAGRAKCLLDHGNVMEAKRVAESIVTGRLTSDPTVDFSPIAVSNKATVLDLIRSAEGK